MEKQSKSSVANLQTQTHASPDDVSISHEAATRTPETMQKAMFPDISAYESLNGAVVRLEKIDRHRGSLSPNLRAEIHAVAIDLQASRLDTSKKSSPESPGKTVDDEKAPTN